MRSNVPASSSLRSVVGHRVQRRGQQLHHREPDDDEGEIGVVTAGTGRTLTSRET